MIRMGILMLLLASGALAQLPPGFSQWIQPTAEEAVATREGIAALKAGKWNEAETAFKKVLEANPDQTMAYLYLGIVYRSKSYFTQNNDERIALRKQAEDTLKEGLVIDPFEARVAYQLGGILFETAQQMPDSQARFDKLQEARDMYQRLILLAPMTREAHYAYVNICADQLRLGAQAAVEAGDRKKFMEIADAGLMHAKLLAEQLDQYNAAAPVMTAQILQYRAKWAETDESREADLQEARKWQTKAETLQPRRGPMVKMNNR